MQHMAYLNSKPKHGQDDTAENGEVAEPEAERRSVQDRKRDMETGTDGPVEYHDHRDDTITDSDAREGLVPLVMSTLALVGEWTDAHQDRPTASMEPASSHVGIVAASDTQ